MSRPVRVADEGDVRVVTLDRPDRRNALTGAALDALREAVTDPPTPVVHLRGAGDAFCAGADLDDVARVAGEVAAADGSDSGDEAVDDERDTDGNDSAGENGGSAHVSPERAREVVEPFVRRGQRTMRAVAKSDAVVVAGVDGAARGGGVELALACDIRVATPDATFAEPGVTFGLFGAWGGTARLPDVVGLGDALDISCSGRVLDSEAAHRVGLVQRVVAEPRAVSEDLAGNDPTGLRLVKERVRDDADLATQEDREVTAFAELVAEHAETLAER
jgi:enoyl-CoA hydratase/carnithine racemase